MVKKKILFPKKPNFWARYKVKIFSTLFAILIWFLVVAGGSFDHVTTIPIEIPTHPDYIIVNEIPRSAKIHINGQGLVLLSFLLFNEGRLQPNFSWEEGHKIIHPTEKDVVLRGNARKLTLLGIIEPDTLHVIIERLRTKKVHIKRMFQIRPHRGYTLVGEVRLEPEMVEIRGPSSAIDTCDSIATEPLILEKVKYPIRKQIELVPPRDKRIALLQSKVLLTADIQKIMEKTLTDIPIQVINLPSNVKPLVLPPRVSITIQGGVSVVSAVSREDIRAYIDYRKPRRSKEINYTLEIEPLPEVQITKIEPERFKVVLERKEVP